MGEIGRCAQEDQELGGRRERERQRPECDGGTKNGYGIGFNFFLKETHQTFLAHRCAPIPDSERE